MRQYVALLRGVNVGGHRKLPMADLRRFLEGIGCEDVVTLLQSGNVLFRGSGRTTSTIETWLESQARTRLGLQTDFFVRTAAEWAAVVERNPFREMAVRQPGGLLVTFLKRPLTGTQAAALDAARRGSEDMHADGRCLYLSFPNGIGWSQLWRLLVSPKLGIRGTGRNWNTVTKVAALME